MFNATLTEDGTLDIFPKCSIGCHYNEVCDGKICSITLGLLGRGDEIPKPCKEYDEQMDKYLLEYLEKANDVYE